ncbi:MAG: DUF5693 family protein [Patescibacteria group bacterium]
MLIIAMGGAAVVPALAARAGREARLRSVTVAVDAVSFTEAAAAAGMDFELVAERLRRAGANGLVVPETTLADLAARGRLLLQPLGYFLKTAAVSGNRGELAERIADDYASRLVEGGLPNHHVIVVFDEALLDFLRRALENRMAGSLSYYAGDGAFAIVVKNRTRFSRLGLGLLEEDLRSARELGFPELVPMLRDDKRGDFTGGFRRDVALAKAYGARAAMFAAPAVPGYSKGTHGIAQAARLLREAGIVPVMRETNLAPGQTDLEQGQRGITRLVAAAGFQAAKYFSSERWFIQHPEVDVEDVVDQWARAVNSRNVRLIYVKPLARGDKTPTQNLDETCKAIAGLLERIEERGLRLGAVEGLGAFAPHRLALFMLAVCAAAAVLLLLLQLAAPPPFFIHACLGLCLAVAVAACFLPGLPAACSAFLAQAAALGAAVAFPSLAGIFLLDAAARFGREAGRPGVLREMGRAAGVLARAAGLALFGGMCVAALLGDSAHLLKLSIFRGVKLALFLPILLYFIAYGTRVGFCRDGNGEPLPLAGQWRKLLETPVQAKYALLFVLIGLVLFVLGATSGNTELAIVPQLERQFRAFLERALLARPRTKELVAFPSLMLLPFFACRGRTILTFLAGMAGMVGLTGLVNSFCHLRTPLVVTAYRCAYSLVFGLAAGAVLIALGVAVRGHALSGRSGGARGAPPDVTAAGGR